MKGSVRQRGSKWQYRFRGPERDPSTGEYPWITKGGFHTKKEAWQACREAMAEADRGRVVKPSTRTVAQFFAEWFAAIEPSIDATTWQNWKDYADTYVIPRIGGERLQRLDEPQLLRLYGQLLAEGRVKRDGNGEMYAYWADRVAKGEAPTAREVSDACETTIHAARAAVRRYKSGIIPKQMTRGLAPKTVRNIHAMIHRAPVDAVAWKYINDNPASNIKPPKRPRTRRKVWKPDQIQVFLMSVQHDRFAALFLLELTRPLRALSAPVHTGRGGAAGCHLVVHPPPDHFVVDRRNQLPTALLVGRGHHIRQRLQLVADGPGRRIVIAGHHHHEHLMHPGARVAGQHEGDRTAAQKRRRRHADRRQPAGHLAHRDPKHDPQGWPPHRPAPP